MALTEKAVFLVIFAAVVVAIALGLRSRSQQSAEFVASESAPTTTEPTGGEVRFYALPGCAVCSQIGSWIKPLEARHGRQIPFILKNSTTAASQTEMRALGIQGHGVALLDEQGTVAWVSDGHHLTREKLEEAFRETFLTEGRPQ